MGFLIALRLIVTIMVMNKPCFKYKNGHRKDFSSAVKEANLSEQETELVIHNRSVNKTNYSCLAYSKQ